jgi:ATP-dependent exoDNAse (exonuclease V) beta subunit
LHQRYSRLLLDEFQDTDPIQIELAVLLASSEPVGDRPWPELAAALEPGRLVVVGDPKQSIYRFRRADIGVYSKTEEVLVERTTRLVTNFRSVPGILDWVNALFGAVMGEGQPGVQPHYVALHPARQAGPPIEALAEQHADDRAIDGADDGANDRANERAAVPVTVLGGPHDKSIPVRQIREEEAADVAAVACRIMEEGWPVFDTDSREWRPPRLSDIAVLIPSRLTLPSLEAAFAGANVPFRPETSSLVYATQEVRDVLSAVRATVDPANAIDVVACLRSSLFAVDDDALLEWKLAGGSWDYRTADPVSRGGDGDGGHDNAGHDNAGHHDGGNGGKGTADLPSDHPVADAFGHLRRWHRGRWWTTAAGFIDQVVRERRLREAALAEPRPRDRWRRYRFLSEQARQFTESEGGDLHDFVAWVEVQSSELARVTEPIPPEPDDDAVRVLTVHGSKGLEFPIVVLAGAPTGESAARPGPKVLFPPGERPQVKLGGDRQTASYDLHAAMEDVLDANERIRLHYVAATRARDHLVASAHHKQPGPQDRRTSIGRRTWDTIGGFPELWRGFERRGDERYDAQRPTQLRLAGGGWGEEQAAWRRTQNQIGATAHRARTRSATDIAASASQLSAWAGDNPRLRRETTPPLSTEDDATTRPPSDADLVGGAALGSAVHRVLETIDFVQPVGLSTLASLAAAEFGLSGQDVVDDIEQRVRHVLATDTIEQARSHRHHRELYVATTLGPSAPAESSPSASQVEGFVDLVIETDEGLLIVDYKTDWLGEDPSRRKAAAESRAADYRLQGATYALALRAITGRPVVGVRFLFTGAEAAYEIDLDDLEAAEDDVRAQVG